MKNKFFSILVVCLVVIPATALASGFGIYDANAKATGMAAAFVGRADDASAIFYNPAGIAFLEGQNVLFGITSVQPHVDVTFAGETTESEQRWVFVPSMFYSTKLTDRIAVGFGVFAPIGLGVQYPENYSCSFVTYRSMGLSVIFRPTIAVKLSDNFAIGGGVDISYSRMKEWRKLPLSMMGFPVNNAVNARYEFDGTGIGFSLGALWKVNEQFSIGAKYRHKVEYDYEGDVDFTYNNSGNAMIDGIVNSIFTDQGTTSGITMPGELAIGIHYKPNEKISLQADVAWTEWSTVDAININHDVSSMVDSPWPMDWEDTWQIRLGGEYWVDHSWAVRAGYAKDNSPIPAETLTPFAPDSDRNEFTIGLGYDTKEACCWGRFFADAAFRYIMLDDVSSEFAFYPADYSADMTFFALSAGFSF